MITYTTCTHTHAREFHARLERLRHAVPLALELHRAERTQRQGARGGHAAAAPRLEPSLQPKLPGRGGVKASPPLAPAAPAAPPPPPPPQPLLSEATAIAPSPPVMAGPGTVTAAAAPISALPSVPPGLEPSWASLEPVGVMSAEDVDDLLAEIDRVKRGAAPTSPAYKPDGGRGRARGEGGRARSPRDRSRRSRSRTRSRSPRSRSRSRSRERRRRGERRRRSGSPGGGGPEGGKRGKREGSPPLPKKRKNKRYAFIIASFFY